jgi:hypothetical protein
MRLSITAFSDHLAFYLETALLLTKTRGCYKAPRVLVSINRNTDATQMQTQQTRFLAETWFVVFDLNL